MSEETNAMHTHRLIPAADYKALNDRVSSLERKVDAIVRFCMESAEGPHSARNRLEEELNDD